ncbi:VOC family protein [Dyadobacter sp. CY323]|uniref:VOC family protein n=1 Tax=Dyadobacter sp. CY323 TaxID=2907302 RepID=UPI001F1E7D44|nr:VOC family protein [Dyadobacter sp. CY323]MCE6992653.1 VOC family protein [Dyadobacter sp. CY323]
MSIYPFLTFNGNCKEAMRFYQSCFGGELHFKYLGDAPYADNLPVEMKHLVLHASLVSEHIRLFASDMPTEDGLFKGNSISLLVSMAQNDPLAAVFTKLSKQGEVTSPLAGSTGKGQWATLKDRYAVQWIFAVGGYS